MNLQRIACIIVACLAVAVNAPANPPNILLVITDEHNFRTLGCYREQLPKEQAEMWGPNTVVETPNLDRIAHEGVICTRAYATAPVCTPSRAAMITGNYPQNTGAPANDLELRDDVPTLARILNTRGYRTGFVGKWHLGGTGKPEWSPRVDGGFQVTTAMFNRGHWKKFQVTDEGPRVGASQKGKPSYAVAGADETSFSTDFLTDRLIEFIESHTDQPFLAVISYPDPHGPNTVRAPYDRQYDHLRFLPPRTYGQTGLAIPGWLAGGTKKHAKFRGEQMSKYFGMVKCIDDNFGRVVKTLADSQRLDNTIILMTSDHGDLCYEHDRLNKGNPYEGSARVPMLLRYPKMIRSGSVFSQPMGTVDVTPTLLALAQIQQLPDFEGRDLSKILSESKHDLSQITFLRNAGTTASWLAAIDSRFKLIVSTKDRPWLMDIEQDPDELHNLYGRPGTHDTTKRLAQALAAYIQRTNDPFGNSKEISDSLQRCINAQ